MSEVPRASFDQFLVSSLSLFDEISSFDVAQHYVPMSQYGDFGPSTLMIRDATYSIPTSASYDSVPTPILQPLSTVPIQQPPSPEAGALSDPIPTFALPSLPISPFRTRTTAGSNPRRIFTAQVRHLICLCYEENKGVTHADIGCESDKFVFFGLYLMLENIDRAFWIDIFGVERRWVWTHFSPYL